MARTASPAWPLKRQTVPVDGRSVQHPNAVQFVIKWLCLLSLFFMIAFPKGGLKIQDIPITIGYILTIPMIIITAPYIFGARFSVHRLLCAALIMVSGMWYFACYYMLGASSVGFTIAFFVSSIYIPMFCLIFFSEITLSKWRSSFETAFVFAVRFIVLYGIFLFFYRMFFDSWIEIPYLTVNADDIGQLDDKHIDRGGIFKAISTYNNGNILGVCLCIIMPLYFRLEKWIYLRFLLLVLLILTLSRTAWIGMIIGGILISLSNGFRISQLLYLIFGAILVAGGIASVLVLLGVDGGFLIDRNIGGRLYSLSYLFDAGFIPNNRGIDIAEIVYIGVAYNYGYIGLILFILSLLAPVLAMKRLGVNLIGKRLPSACAQGVLIYMIIAMSDGAYNFIPTMMIFWMVASWGIWYAEPSYRRAAARS